MRNLSVRYVRERTAFETSDDVRCRVTAEGRLLVLVGGRRLLRQEKEEEDDDEPLELPEDLECGKCARIVDADCGEVVLAYEEGLLVKVDVTGATEVVGRVDAGIEDLVRSPDEELFALVTRGGTAVVLMSREFDPLAEVDLRQGGFGDAGFVDVGWGKKETQFHGSLGKAAAKTSAAASATSRWDDGKVRLVWREDGQLFAVSTIFESRRCIRVFSREGVLQSTSEPVDGLEHCLAWKPSGALIASTQRLPNKLQVVFFERNGLRHGEFQLPFAVDELAVVTELAWNRDSDALLVCLKTPESSFVQIYSCSNYAWSLKQSWSRKDEILYALWDVTQALRFHLVSRGGKYEAVQLGWEISHSEGLDENDHAMVSVVDGPRARMTPLRQTVVPPPMSAFELHVPDDIQQIIFHPSVETEFGNCNTVGLVTKNAIFIFASVAKDDCPTDPKVRVTGAGGTGFLVKSSLQHFIAECKIPEVSEFLNNFRWLGSNVILATASVPAPRLVVFELKKLPEGGGTMLTKVSEHACEEAPFSITSDTCGSIAAIQLSDGTVLKYERESDELTPWPLESGEFLKLPSVCVKIKLAVVGDACHVLGLTDRHRLYLDGIEIGSNITSFHLHSEFLMVTNLRHMLRCLPIECLPELVDKSNSASTAWSSESVRALERGARLVLAIPSHSQTVLQMPRGNLEVIHPRALLLHLVRDYLDQGKYGLTMEVLRRHRINLNLVVDHNPDKFINNVGKFVEEAGGDVQRLCLFIADLMEEDCTQTMYASIYSGRQSCHTWSEGSGKINSVCQALMRVLEVDEQRYLLPIVSCLIKDSTSDVANALNRISKMRGINPGLANEALQFLLLLVDVKALFDVALGMYDFELVLFVAEKSQLDPKEFLPFLNELKKLPLLYRMYKIDLHLKRYPRALEHLSQITDGDDDHTQECLELVRSQRLYSLALELFRSNSHMLVEICRLYGNYLTAKKYYEDAALIFERSELRVEAVEAWEKSLNWRHCLAVAQAIPLPQRDFQQLCQRLVERLKEERRHSEASLLLRDYMADDEEAIETLVLGHQWSEAFRVIQKANRKDLMETHFVPHLKEHWEHTLASVKSKRKAYDDGLDRLRKVLETRQKVASGLHAEEDINVEDADLYSEVTSVAGMSGISASDKKSNPASLKTRNTQRSKSSKNRRKHEKKKYSIREGSSFEDIGLVSLLHETITSTIKCAPEVGELTRALLVVGDIAAAKEVQGELSLLIQRMKLSIDQIWKHTGPSPPQQQQLEESEVKFGPQATTADIVVGQQQQSLTASYEIPWHILEPHMRYPPNLDAIGDAWKLQILEQ